MPLVLAVFLDRGIPLRTVLRSAFFFPFTLSVVTVGLTWLWLLDPVVGPFNYYLKAAGVPVRAWLADPSTAMWAIILTTVWWVTGYYLVIYLAGLQDIPPELYEAAAIDGASGWRRFWSITLPLLRPVFLFVLVTHIIGSFQIFGQVYILTDGGPGDATRTVVQHLYETAFRNFFQFGSATAMAWVLFVIILGLLAAAVPPAPRPHGVLMASTQIQGPRRASSLPAHREPSGPRPRCRGGPRWRS